jgi:hypothetical protein
MFSRFFEASSWAGIAGVIHAVAELVATQGASPQAWGVLIASIAAVAIPEKKAGE